MSEKDDALELGAVIERFGDSEKSLREIQAALQSIVLSEQGASKSSEILEVAATEVRDLAKAVNSSVRDAAKSAAALNTASKAAKSFLESTDLSRLERSMAALDMGVQSVVKVLEQGQRDTQALHKLVEGFGSRVDDLANDLDQVKGALPGRVKKRLDEK